MSATLEECNAALRQAVETRLAGGCCEGERPVCQPAFNPPPVPAAETITVAEQTLQSALDAVRDRHRKYGAPIEHFGRTAELVNAAFGTAFTAADWALVMVLDKVARLRGPMPTTDGGVDIAGYGSCYEECRSR